MPAERIDGFDKRINGIDQWIAAHDAKIDAWWSQQFIINEKREEKERVMASQIALLASELSTHQTECVSHRRKVELMDNKLDLIDDNLEKYARERSLLQGGYAAACLVLTAIASILGLAIAAYSAFK